MAEILHSIDSWLVRNSFRRFVDIFYQEVSAGTKFIPTFHTSVLIRICQLKAEGKLKHKNVIITIPPGHTKTTICNLLFSAWLLARTPNLRIIYGCNSTPEGNKRNKDLLDLISSDLYKKYFKDFRLRTNNITWFISNAGGFRQVVSTDIKMRFTGGDADLLLIDDPNDTTGTKLDFEKVKEWFYKKAIQRLRGTERDMGFFLIQQMTGTGCLANELKNDPDTFFLILRAEEEYDINIEIPIVIDKDGIKIETIETITRHKGYLWDAKIADYEKLKTTKPYIWECQYQQNPKVTEGSLFKHEQIESVQIPYHNITSKKGYYIISVDTASSLKQGSDYSAVALLKMCYEGDNVILYLENLFNLKKEPYDLSVFIGQMADAYRGNCCVLIEENHVGVAVRNLLEINHGVDIRKIERNSSLRMHAGDERAKTLKSDMALSLLFKILQKKIFFPLDNEVHFMYDLKNQMLSFPDSEHDDMVDSITNCVHFLIKNMNY